MKLTLIYRISLAAFFAALSCDALAQELIIETRVALANGDPQYEEGAGNWANSSVHTTAPGVTAGVGSRFNTRADSFFTLRPQLQPGGKYLIQAAFPNTFGSQSDDIICRIDLVGATLTELGPQTTLEAGVLQTTVFQEPGPFNAWRPIGTLTVGAEVTIPEITFTHIGGNPSRFYADAFRFVNASDPCLNGLPVLATVNGPLAAGQTFVNVPGVDTTATKVSVYADGVQIGQKASGILGGTNVEVVVTSPLVAGQVITVTQHNPANVESCRPNSGPVVGSGPNPPIRISYSLRMDSALSGPIGAEGTSSSTWLWMLGASGPASGFGTAPLDGAVLQPGTCWQTVSFDYSVDSGYTWAGTAGDTPTFAILDSIAFSMEPPFDSGPYVIYVDNIVNGTNLIEDFEAAEAGVNYLLNAPNFSGTTTGFLLSQPPGTPTPNVSVVSDANADTGTNSALLSWQFKDAAAASWVRIPLQGSGRKNPQIDLSKPVSIRFLVLPVGQTNTALQVASIGNVTGTLGKSVTLEAATIRGTGTFTYQWKKDGQDIAGATGPTHTISSATAEAAGNYSVVVSNGTCTTESFGTLTITDEPEPPVLTFSREGTKLVLTWTDPQAVLQSATLLTGSPNDWTDVDAASSPYEPPMNSEMQFFRLRR